MTVEAEGFFYHNVISITQITANKAVLVMPDTSVAVSIFSPVRIIGSAETGRDPAKPPEK